MAQRWAGFVSEMEWYPVLFHLSICLTETLGWVSSFEHRNRFAAITLLKYRAQTRKYCSGHTQRICNFLWAKENIARKSWNVWNVRITIQIRQFSSFKRFRFILEEWEFAQLGAIAKFSRNHNEQIPYGRNRGGYLWVVRCEVVRNGPNSRSPSGNPPLFKRSIFKIFEPRSLLGREVNPKNHRIFSSRFSRVWNIGLLLPLPWITCFCVKISDHFDLVKNKV